MKAKKTIEVAIIKANANKVFETSTCSAEERKTLACFVSDVLHSTGNYRGFQYLPSESNINSGFYGKDCRINFF